MIKTAVVLLWTRLLGSQRRWTRANTPKNPTLQQVCGQAIRQPKLNEPYNGPQFERREALLPTLKSLYQILAQEQHQRDLKRETLLPRHLMQITQIKTSKSCLWTKTSRNSASPPEPKVCQDSFNLLYLLGTHSLVSTFPCHSIRRHVSLRLSIR